MNSPGGYGTRISCGLLLLLSGGCAAARPLNGIPVRELSEELRMPMRSGRSMIDLSLLRQTPPAEHRVDAGDTLGIYVEGVLGGRQESPPVNFPQNPNARSSLGYPIRVRDDGTISLPLIDPIDVRGMTIGEVERRIRAAYTTGNKPLLKAGNDRILVTMRRPRHYRVLVIRQEAGNPSSVAGRAGRSARTGSANGKQGTGRVVELPAYSNDVLHALAETGGLPGLDAENVIYVIRRRRRSGRRREPTVISPVKPAPRADEVPALPPTSGAKNFAPLGRREEEDRLRRALRKAAREDRGQTDSFKKMVIRGQSPELPPWARHPEPPSTGGRRRRDSGGLVDAGAYRGFVPARVARAAPQNVPRRSRWTPALSASSRRASPVSAGAPAAPPGASSWPAAGTMGGGHVVRIPLRVFPGQPLPFSEEDIILEDGDVVVIESRENDLFYTGGLLGGGEYRLPRDRDLDVLQAIALVQSSATQVLPTRAVGGVAATNQDVTAGASDLIVLRTMPDGTQLPIKVDLYRAMRNPQERIYVRPGDRLVLQYKCYEACTAFFERHILDYAILGISSGLFFNN